MALLPEWIKTHNNLHYVYFNNIISSNDGDACISCVTHEKIHNLSAPVCIDIGADLGWWSLFCREYNATSIIHAFEPNPVTYTSLQQYESDIFSLYNMAVSNNSASILIEFDDSSSHSRGDTGVRVKTTTLDFIFDKTHKVDIIKIDTEGHDIIIVSSLEKYFHRINTLIFEFTTYWNGSNRDECIKNSLDALELVSKFYPYIYILCRNASLTAIQITDISNFLPVIVLLYNNHYQVDILCTSQSITSLNIINEDMFLSDFNLVA
jgi:FkbM family methyltransferase